MRLLQSDRLPGFGSPAEGIRGATAAALTALALSSNLMVGQPAAAVDSAAIGTCLIKNCPGPLARCVTDGSCLANLLCIQTCTGKPDESECQIKCGDEFSDDVVASFTKCAVTDKKCVPQRPDDGSYPVPADSALVEKFDPRTFTGTWYITAGLNKAFDVFDCQKHEWTAPTPTSLQGQLQWRIKDPIAGSQFVTRYTVQNFVQDESRPGILYNHDNEFLNYQDDWYILAEKKNEYLVIYYRGSNDAWDGYGGCTIYTKSPQFPKKYEAEVAAAVKKIGLRWEDFTLTDNTCKPRESRLEEFEQDFEFVESKVLTGIQLVGEEVAKDVVAVEQEVVKDVVAVEKEVIKDVVAAEKEVVRDVVAVEKEVVKDVVAVEKEVVKDVVAIEKEFEKDFNFRWGLKK